MKTHRSGDAADPWDWCWVRRVCLNETQRVLGESTQAEDAAQEAIIRAWRGLGACRDPEKPAGWLRAIARHEALRITAQPTEQPLPAERAGRWEADDASGLRIDLRRALVAMTRSERALIGARYWEDLTVAEAARRLGMPEGTAKVRLHRLRTQLRQTLSES